LKNTVLGMVTTLLVSSFAITSQAAILGVPSYTYPGTSSDFWSNLPSIEAHQKGHRAEEQATALFIVNPNSGVGAAKDASYSAAVQKARAHGVQLYGYIFTHYGARSADDIKKEAALYKSWYGVDGIFLDEAQLDADHLAYYAGLSQSFKKLGLQTAFNPGQPQIDNHFMSLAEHIVTFEGSYEDYQTAKMPSWMFHYPASKFWHMIYNVPNAEKLQKTIDQAGKNNAGVVFVTNDTLPNPYDSVPSYWSQELKLLRGH
jgi:Spherulation-specific family 4